MEFKIEVLSNKCLLGEVGIDMMSISKFLLRYGVTLNSILFCSEETKVEEIDSPIIFVMPDEKIDDFVASHKFFYETKAEIVDLVAILGGKDFPVVIIPLESDIISVLEKVFEKIKTNFNLSDKKVYRLFGKSVEEVKKMLQEGDINAKVYGDGPLVDIYIQQKELNDFISDEEIKINQIFENYIYSQTFLSMREIIEKMLNLRKEKLFIMDSFTCGETAREILIGNCKDVTSQTFSVLDDEGFLRVTEGLFKTEEELVEKLSLNAIKEHKGDVVVVIAGRKFNNSFKVTIAIGKKESVDIYNLRVDGSIKDAITMGKNWTLFNLIKKLKEKDFEKIEN